MRHLELVQFQHDGLQLLNRRFEYGVNTSVSLPQPSEKLKPFEEEVSTKNKILNEASCFIRLLAVANDQWITIAAADPHVKRAPQSNYNETQNWLIWMSEPTISITVKLFAAYQEAYGVPELQLRLPSGVTAVELRDRLIHEHPHLAEWREVTRYGVNLQFVEPQTVLQDGDEVVLIPPVSGGVED